MDKSKKLLLEKIETVEKDGKLTEFQPNKNYTNLERIELCLNLSTIYNDVFFGNIGWNLLPLNLRVKSGITLFGLTDYFGAFQTSSLITPTIPDWIFTAIGIQHFNFNYTWVIFPQGSLLKYWGEITGQYIKYFNITSGVIPYGTVLNNLADSIYLIKSLKIIIPFANINQINNPLLLSKQNINGQMVTDSIDLTTYVLPSNYQTTIVDIPLNIILDKNLMINQYIEFDCVNIQYIFSLIKVK